MLLPKFLSRKKLSRKYRSILASKISPATGVTYKRLWKVSLRIFFHPNSKKTKKIVGDFAARLVSVRVIAS